MLIKARKKQNHCCIASTFAVKGNDLEIEKKENERKKKKLKIIEEIAKGYQQATLHKSMS